MHWGISGIGEPQRSSIILSSLHTKHTLAQSLSPVLSTMNAQPKCVQMNGIQISDLKLRNRSPERLSGLPKITVFAFDGAGITTLRSPDPQSTLFYAFKGGKKHIFQTFLALYSMCFSSFKWSKKTAQHHFQQADKQRWAVQKCTLGKPPLSSLSALTTPCLKSMKNTSPWNSHHLLSTIIVRTLSNRDQHTTDLFSLYKGKPDFGNLLLEIS